MSRLPIPETGRVAGIDFGSVRIGIAVSDIDRKFSSPYETYIRKSPAKDAEYFVRLVSEERIVAFVLGMPIHLSGDMSEKGEEVLQFADWLQTVTRLPIRFVDERYTSVEAERILRNAKLTNKQRLARRDKLAAQMILAAFLEAGCESTLLFDAVESDRSDEPKTF